MSFKIVATHDHCRWGVFEKLFTGIEKEIDHNQRLCGRKERRLMQKVERGEVRDRS